jgi:hypothetical protein
MYRGKKKRTFDWLLKYNIVYPIISLPSQFLANKQDNILLETGFRSAL